MKIIENHWKPLKITHCIWSSASSLYMIKYWGYSRTSTTVCLGAVQLNMNNLAKMILKNIHSIHPLIENPRTGNASCPRPTEPFIWTSSSMACSDNSSSTLQTMNTQEYTRKKSSKNPMFYTQSARTINKPVVLLVNLWSCRFLLGIHSTSCPRPLHAPAPAPRLLASSWAATSAASQHTQPSHLPPCISLISPRSPEVLASRC